jgi:hypothetical protein
VNYPSQTYRRPFFVEDEDGNPCDLDSTPTLSFVRNDEFDAAVVPTYSKVTTGEYVVEAAIPSGYAAADEDFDGPISLDPVIVQVAPPTAAENAAATAAQVTTDHGSGSYIRNTEPLDAAGTRTALGMATNNLDTQLAAKASQTSVDTANAVAAAIRKVVEADVIVDKTTNPAAWAFVFRERGTATELFRKNVKDVEGAAIGVTTTVVGQAVQ